MEGRTLLCDGEVEQRPVTTQGDRLVKIGAGIVRLGRPIVFHTATPRYCDNCSLTSPLRGQ